ncbi:unnamed protein product [Cylicocyclus nassatus]|uniref:HEAT repeat-containing protein 1 n=1 Tax=Cylicocyclus nassatus TaxID=53992 RepID=A0AA36GEB5_CYLNA|nr:unnamed protein product [Cylicocyclus nassatus]
MDVQSLQLLVEEVVAKRNELEPVDIGISSKALFPGSSSIQLEMPVDHQNQSEDAASKRRRVRQQSLSRKKLGSSTFLICALTCTQRVLDQFAPFVSQYIPEVLVQFCRLYGRVTFHDLASGCHDVDGGTNTYVPDKSLPVFRHLAYNIDSSLSALLCSSWKCA